MFPRPGTKKPSVSKHLAKGATKQSQLAKRKKDILDIHIAHDLGELRTLSRSNVLVMVRRSGSDVAPEVVLVAYGRGGPGRFAVLPKVGDHVLGAFLSVVTAVESVVRAFVDHATGKCVGCQKDWNE